MAHYVIVCSGTAACRHYDELVSINFIIKQVNSETRYSVAGLLRLAKEIGLANSTIGIFLLTLGLDVSHTHDIIGPAYTAL